jgi:hypothetical protein
MSGDAHSADGTLEELLLRWIVELAPRYRWTGRAGLDGFLPSIERRSMLGEFEQGLRDPSAQLLLERGGGTEIATTFLRPQPMETEHFDLPVSSLSYVICDPETPDRRRVVQRLLERATATAADAETELVVLRVSSGDVDTLAAAQCAGFRVVETTVTYLGEAQSEPVRLPDGVTVDVHEGPAGDVLTSSEVDELAAETAVWELSRFRADPNLSNEVVDRYYRAWVPNIASGQFSDCLYVARHRGELAGVYAENTDQGLLDLTGTALRVGAWMIVLRPRLGVGRSLMRTSAAHRFPGGRFHENETQLHNVAAIRCFDHMKIVRSGYTLHAWPRRT